MSNNKTGGGFTLSREMVFQAFMAMGIFILGVKEFTSNNAAKVDKDIALVKQMLTSIKDTQYNREDFDRHFNYAIRPYEKDISSNTALQKLTQSNVESLNIQMTSAVSTMTQNKIDISRIIDNSEIER